MISYIEHNEPFVLDNQKLQFRFPVQNLKSIGYVKIFDLY